MPSTNSASSTCSKVGVMLSERQLAAANAAIATLEQQIERDSAS